MERTFSKRITVRIISFAVSAVILAAAAGYGGYYIISRYKNTLEGKYQMSLNDLSDYTSNIRTTLEKSIYANTTAQQQPSFAKLMSMSEGAKSSLSHLPMSTGQATAIQKYFAQVGDYSFYALSKIAKNESLTDEEKKTLRKLYEYSVDLDMSVKDMASTYADGSVAIGKPITLKGNIEKIDDEELALDGGFREMNEGFADYPTMIYDGPFSDHITKRKSIFLKNQPEINENQAKVIASNFMNTDKNALVFEGETKGNLPTYNFSSGSRYITVTKKGGYVNIFRSDEIFTKTTLSTDDAIAEGKKRLTQIFRENFAESYYSIHDNICTINFAYTNNDVIYYPDLIKISISLQTGEMVGYCATNYIMNHHTRDEFESKISESTAQNALSKDLRVQSCKKAVIQTSGMNEVNVYEFNCTAGNETLLIYINCDTAQEEHIYIVMKSENGTLVL